MIIGIVFCVMGLIMICAGAGVTSLGKSTGEGDDMMLFLYIFGGIGLLFFIIGLPFLIVAINKRKDMNRLLESGVQAEGIITNVVLDYYVRVNNRHPYRAECKVTDPVTGAVYLYSSPRIMKDITHLEGSTVTVYYDPDNRKKYYVDIEAAIAAAEEHGAEVYDYR